MTHPAPNSEPDVAGARERLLLVARDCEEQPDLPLMIEADDATQHASADASSSLPMTDQGEEIERLRGALDDLLTACESDFGVPDEDDEDDEPVATGQNGWKSAVTFGLLRRARARQGGTDHVG